MTYKEFFDLKMILLLVTMLILLSLMFMLSPLGNLDSRFFYSQLEANDFLKSLSLETHTHYRFVEMLDLFFIYKYSRALTLALSRLYPNTLLWLVGLIPGVFDLVETGTILKALFMPEPQLMVYGLGVVTAIKWVMAALVVGFVFVSLFFKTRESN